MPGCAHLTQDTDEVEMNDKLDPVIELVSELSQAFNASPKPGSERQPFIDALVAWPGSDACQLHAQRQLRIPSRLQVGHVRQSQTYLAGRWQGRAKAHPLGPMQFASERRRNGQRPAGKADD